MTLILYLRFVLNIYNNYDALNPLL